MSSISDKAIYVDENKKFTVKTNIEHEDPAPNELLIEVHYSGVNPADVRHSTMLGISSTVLGYDFAGRVIKASSSSNFVEGDIVAGYTPCGLGRPKKYGAHQNHLAVPDDMVFKVPSNLPESHAAALPVVVMTAADAIHNIFKFSLPTDSSEIFEPILIWGASSAVGLSALQLARASGCRNILVTASPARHEILKTLGATEAFDYSSPTVTDDIASFVAKLGKGSITHALDAAGSFGNPSSADLMIQSVSESTKLSSVIFLRDENIQSPFAASNMAVTFHPLGMPEPITFPANVAKHWHAWKALQWVVENYGSKFSIPVVNVISGSAEECLEAMLDAANGKRGFGKTILQHPWN